MTQIETRALPDKDFGLAHNHLVQTATYFISGSNSMYVPSLKLRYINESVCRMWPDDVGMSVAMTPGQAARTELSRQFPGLRRVGWRAGMVRLFDARPPMHYSGAHHGDMVQIDLRSAYYQVYRLLWLNIPYPRGFGTLALMPVAERLKEWKAARNAVIGLCASRSAIGVKGPTRYTLRTQNKFLSPGLWASVQDMLHAIAAVALWSGALYVNTDGYIFYDRSPWLEFTEWLTDLGFAWEFKGIGEGHITGWNSYRVGDRQTAVYRLKLEVRQNEYTNIRTNKVGEQIRFINACRKVAASIFGT